MENKIMNKSLKKNVIISSIMAIGLSASLICGATFALFTSESKANIAISGGKVDVVATINDDFTTYSGVNITGNSEADVISATETNGTFTNGGFASLSENTLSLTNLTPGDKVTFSITVKNNSTVKVKYRTRLICEEDTGLYEGLVYTIGGYQNMAISDWAELAVNSDDVTFDCSIALPTDAGTEYQDKSCSISFIVEAVQGNVATKNDIAYYTLDQFNALTEIPEDIETVYLYLGNRTVSYGATASDGKWYNGQLTIGNTSIADTFAYMAADGTASTGNTVNIKKYDTREEAEADTIPEGYRVNCYRENNGKYTTILETAKKGFTLVVSGTINVTDVPANLDSLTMGNGADISFCIPGNCVVVADGLEVNGIAKIWTKRSSPFVSSVFSHKVPELIMKNCNLNMCWLMDGLTIEKVSFENCTFNTMAYKNVKNSNPIWWRMTTKLDAVFTNCTVKSILPVKFETPKVTPKIEITGCTFDIAKSEVYSTDTRNYGVMFSSQSIDNKYGDITLTNNKLLNETAGLVTFYDANTDWAEGCYLTMNGNDVKNGKVVQMYKTAENVVKSYMKGTDFGA